eukprot:1364070-Rhodomonas_salina.2
MFNSRRRLRVPGSLPGGCCKRHQGGAVGACLSSPEVLSARFLSAQALADSPSLQALPGNHTLYQFRVWRMQLDSLRGAASE